MARVPEGLPAAGAPETIRVTPSLWMIVADVPTDVYAGAGQEQALADLERVGRMALAHEAVVEHFAKQPSLTVIPLKLFTMFSSREKAAADIGARKTAIERAMRRIAGAEEWGIRVFHADGTATVTTSAASATRSGAAFLTAKKQARDNARTARRAAAEAATDVFNQLSRLARDAHQRLDAPPTAAAPPLLDAAFLVPVEKRAAFQKAARRAAEACDRAGAELTLTGPWPAYHFAAAE